LAAWFLAGCTLVAAVQGVFLWQHNWDATAFLHVGVSSPARPQLERELGPIVPTPGSGHDGKYFYLIARSPWFWKADAALLTGLQDPAYRYGRPLYPLIAGLGGTLSPWATLAGLVLVQVIAGGLFVAAIASLARQNHLPTRAVLLGLASPCLYSSSVLLTSDLLALALLMLGVAQWQRDRVGRSVAFFAAAALAKEYYVLTPIVLALVSARRKPGAALALGLLPLVPLAVWRLAVASVLGIGEGAGNFTWPGGGIIAAAPWWEERTAGTLAILIVTACLAGTVRSSRPLLRWQCFVWGLLGLCASELVWIDPNDLLRVIAPAWWFAVWCWWPAKAGPA
jgi:hypothetical protein